MPRTYGKKAGEKVARALHELKRGKLRSGSGRKVTSREQAIAIGLSQARRAGGKAPPARHGHATMSLDARVRAYLSKMQPGAEIDARGLARALGGDDPLSVDYALERAVRDGVAVTSDGRWFSPAGARISHAKMRRSPAPPKKKSSAQLDREIAETLSRDPEPIHHPVPFRAPTVAEAARIANAAAGRTKAAVRFGDDRVFIIGAWSALTPAERDVFDDDLDLFKASLIKANREGLLILARADLVGAMNPKLVAGSHIRYLNSDFHFIILPEHL